MAIKVTLLLASVTSRLLVYGVRGLVQRALAASIKVAL